MNIGPVHKLALFYVESLKVGEELDQNFWNGLYGYKPNRIVEDLVKDEYVIKGFDLEHSVNCLKVPELKEILREHDLKVSGNKPNLIKRIIDNSDILDYSKMPDMFILTTKGKELKNNSEHILYFHKNVNDIDIFRADKLYKKFRHMKPVEAIEGILNDEFKKSINKKDYASASFYSGRLIEFYNDYNMIEKELKYITITMSCNVIMQLEFIEFTSNSHLENYNSSIIGYNIGSKTKFKSLTDKYYLTTEEKKNYIMEIINPIFKDSDLSDITSNIIIWAINDENEKIKKYVWEIYDLEAKKKKNEEERERMDAILSGIQKVNTPKDEQKKVNSPIKQENKGCGCVLFLLLPGTLTAYGMIEWLFI